MVLASPALAALAMLLTGLVVFLAIGRNPAEAAWVFFVKPLDSLYGIGELFLKATPLLLCALGLGLGFRSNVWNIGAEGQLTVGALAGGGVALALGEQAGAWGFALMIPAAILGGMAWAAIPAFLRARFNTNEILTTLMLVYIAQLLLSYMVHGPWRDPQGHNFPQSRAFADSLLVPVLVEGARTHWGLVVALLLAGVFWLFAQKSWAGFQLHVAGIAPAAASYAGFSARRGVWVCLLTSGATAGLAGIFEVAGPLGQLQQQISPGYGFAAIIVAFVGRLHPVGMVFAALLMSLLYLGGESAQIGLNLPAAITGLFQGVLLFYLLAADLLITHRLRNERPGDGTSAAPRSVPARGGAGA